MSSEERGDVFYGLHNGPAPGGSIHPIQLRHGFFLAWDEPPGEIPEDLKDKPDWKTEIERDVFLRPVQSAGVRVITLFMNHLTGTGSYTYIFALDCNAGRPRKLFEASGQGLKLEHVTERHLDVSVGIWQAEDAHCCPSLIRQIRYQWSPRLNRYRRMSSKVGCEWMP